jgi:hypothetical protein
VVRTRGLGVVGLVLGGLVGGYLSCADATEIFVDVRTDVPCDRLPSTRVSGGRAAGDTDACGPGPSADLNEVGTISLVPSGAADELVTVTVITGFGKPAADCTEGDARCVFARRRLRYLRHTKLQVPVEMRAACLGVVCDPTSTCVQGGCVAADVGNPAIEGDQDASGTFDAASLADVGGGSGGDTGVGGGDAGSDAPLDAPLDALAPPACTTALYEKVNPSNQVFNLSLTPTFLVWSTGTGLAYAPRSSIAAPSSFAGVTSASLVAAYEALAAPRAYWTGTADGGATLFHGSPSGNTSVAPSAVDGLVTTPVGVGYVTERDAGAVFTTTAGTSPLPVPPSSLGPVGPLAVDPSSGIVFVGAGTQLLRLAGGTKTVLRTGVQQITHVALDPGDATRIFWVEQVPVSGPATLYAGSRVSAGQSPTHLYTTVSTNVSGLAATPFALVWTEGGAPSTVQRLTTGAVPAAKPVTILTNNQGGTGSVVADASCVYFVVTGGLAGIYRTSPRN